MFKPFVKISLLTGSSAFVGYHTYNAALREKERWDQIQAKKLQIQERRKIIDKILSEQQYEPIRPKKVVKTAILECKEAPPAVVKEPTLAVKKTEPLISPVKS